MRVIGPSDCGRSDELLWTGDENTIWSPGAREIGMAVCGYRRRGGEALDKGALCFRKQERQANGGCG